MLGLSALPALVARKPSFPSRSLLFKDPRLPERGCKPVISPLGCQRRVYLTSTRYDRGDIAFIMVAGALVFFMIPGLCS